MSNYKSLIDEAMKTAQYRLSAGVEKTASAFQEDSIVKEASELANALEYMSMSAANDGSLAGSARAEIIRDFYKSATAERLGTKLAGTVGESSTHIDGEQQIAPSAGKTKLMAKKQSGGNPMISASPDSTGKTMLESYKQAQSEGTTLYDILMHQKEAGDVGEMAADQYMSISSKNENSNRAILGDASILSGVSKSEAKAPVRKRLQEAFASTSDTLGDATVSRLFPLASSRGGLKKTAYYDGVAAKPMYELSDLDIKRRAAMGGDNAGIAAGVLGGLGGLYGAGMGAAAGGAPGAIVGGLAGGLTGAGLGYGGNKLDQYLMERELKNRAKRGLSKEASSIARRLKNLGA